MLLFAPFIHGAQFLCNYVQSFLPTTVVDMLKMSSDFVFLSGEHKDHCNVHTVVAAEVFVNVN